MENGSVSESGVNFVLGGGTSTSFRECSTAVCGRRANSFSLLLVRGVVPNARCRCCTISNASTRKGIGAFAASPVMGLGGGAFSR